MSHTALSDQSDPIHHLFVQALAKAPDTQKDWVQQQTEDDPDTRQKVLELLELDRSNREDGFLTDLSDLTLEWLHHKYIHSGHIGPYRVLRLIGSGGFGTVLKVALDRPKTIRKAKPAGRIEHTAISDREYSQLNDVQAAPARDKRSHQVFAIKILHPWAMRNSVLKRFLREQAALERIKHPSVVRYIGNGFHQGQPYLVMKYVPGKTLAELLRDSNGNASLERFPLERRVAWFRAICDGVTAAHHQLVLHRDLKPANIIIDRHNRAVVTDFGLAKDMQLESEQSELSTSGSLLGTLPFMSPEQIKGNRQLQVTSDVYGLGAILYFLLTGRPPHRAGNLAELGYAICNTPPVPPRKMDATIPRDLETICLHCLEKSPRRRYSSVEQLRDELERYVNKLPIRVRPVGNIERILYWTKRHPAVAGLSAMLVFFITISIFTFAWLWSDAAESRDRSQIKNAHLLSTISDLTELLKSVERDPSSLRLQGEMLRKIAASYDRMDSVELLDRSTLHAAGVAWFKLGRVENQLSNVAAKIQAYQRAEYYFRKILREHAGDIQDQFDLFHSLTSQNRNEEALELIQEIVDRDTSNNLYYRDALSDSLLKLSRAKSMDRLYEEALETSSQGLKIAEDLAAIQPQHAHFPRKIGQHLMLQGDIQFCLGNLDECLRLYQESCFYLDEAQRLDPAELAIYTERNYAYCTVASVGIELGIPESVRGWIEQAEEIMRHLTENFSGYYSEWQCGERTFRTRLQFEITMRNEEAIQRSRQSYEGWLQSRLAEVPDCLEALERLERYTNDPLLNAD